MISASLNRCKGMEDQVGDFLKQLAAKLELVLSKRCVTHPTKPAVQCLFQLFPALNVLMTLRCHSRFALDLQTFRFPVTSVHISASHLLLKSTATGSISFTVAINLVHTFILRFDHHFVSASLAHFSFCET